MSDCIFCKIIAGDIPSTKVYENDKVLAFLDIAPVADTHIVLVPKLHVKNVLEGIDAHVMSDMHGAVKCIVSEQGLVEDGFRLVMNTGENAGQSVFHLHMHILAGGKLTGSFGK